MTSRREQSKLIDDLAISSPSAGVLRIQGVSESNEVAYLVLAVGAEPPGESDEPTGYGAVTPMEPFSFDVTGLSPGAVDVYVGETAFEPVAFSLPVGFTNWSFDELSIMRTGRQRFEATLDTAALTPETDADIYLDAVSGVDDASGLSLGSPLKTLDAAINLATNGRIITDDFNREDGPNTTGGNWTRIVGSGNSQIVSNQLVSSTTIHQVDRYDLDTLTADQFAEVDVVTLPSDGTLGVAVRIGDSTCYGIWVRNSTTNTYRIYYYDGSGWNLLQSVNTTAPTVPFRWRGEIIDGVLRGLVDDVEVISHELESDVLASNRRVGVYFSAAGKVVDNFAGGDVAGSGIASPRFRFKAGSYSLSESLPSSFIFEKDGEGVATVSSPSLIVPPSGANFALKGMRFTTGIETTNGTQLIQACLFQDTNPSSANAIHLQGTGKAAIVDTEVVGAGRDCISGRNSKQILELRCRVHNSGNNESDNTSTMHTASRAVRIDGDYYNAPRVIHDVNASQSVNLGCRIRTSKGMPGESTSFLVGAGFSGIGGESVKLWLYGCDMSGGGATCDIYGDTDATIYIDEDTLYDQENVSSNAVIEVL